MRFTETDNQHDCHRKKVTARDKTPGREENPCLPRGRQRFHLPNLSTPVLAPSLRTYVAVSCSSSFPPSAPSLVVRFALLDVFGTFVTMPGMMLTESQLSNLPQLEPALEALLRSADLHENLINLFRFRKILDRQLFVALDENETAILRTLAKAFQLDTDEFEDKLELSKISKAWSTAKVQSDTKRKVDAVQKAHGEPVQLLSEDWASLMRQFKKKYGKQRRETGFQRAPAQVISETEEEEQRKLKPEPSRHLGINLDASLMIQTRRRYLSAMPQNTEQLRTK